MSSNITTSLDFVLNNGYREILFRYHNYISFGWAIEIFIGTLQELHKKPQLLSTWCCFDNKCICHDLHQILPPHIQWCLVLLEVKSSNLVANDKFSFDCWNQPIHVVKVPIGLENSSNFPMFKVDLELEKTLGNHSTTYKSWIVVELYSCSNLCWIFIKFMVGNRTISLTD